MSDNREVVINLAALQNESFSDDPQKIGATFTLERDGALLDAGFRVLHKLHHVHRALLHILRAALNSVPDGIERITIISAFQNLIRIGSSGQSPMTNRRFWGEVRHCLAPYEVTWKLTPLQDERQRALVRCLRALLEDHTLAGPRLATRSRRLRKADRKASRQKALSAGEAISAGNN